MTHALQQIRGLLWRAKSNATYNLQDLQRHHYPADDLKDVISDLEDAINRITKLLEPSAPNGGCAVSQPNETKTNKYQQNKNNT